MSLAVNCNRAAFLAVAWVLLASVPAFAAEEVLVKHILVRTEAEAKTIRDKIVAGGGDRKAFIQACRVHSKDATTKKLGGTLPWFGRRGEMDASFTRAAFNLEKGQISAPTKSEYGWHLIYLVDKRDRGRRKTPPPEPPKDDPSGKDDDTAGVDTPRETEDRRPPQSPDKLSPNITNDPKRTTTEPKTTAAIKPRPKYEPKPAIRRPKHLRLAFGTRKSADMSARQQFRFNSKEAVELNVVLSNQGTQAMTFFDPSLFPMGFTVTSSATRQPLKGDFAAIAEPENFFHVVEPHEFVGLDVNLNDYFKGLGYGRYSVRWDKTEFFNNLEARFPDVKELPDYAKHKGEFDNRTALEVQTSLRPLSLRFQRRRSLELTIFEDLQLNEKYYARIEFRDRSSEPVIIELATKDQFRAAKHFAMLAMEGFYDSLNFYDIRPGDYLIGGCPNYNGSGAPFMRLPTVRNNKLKHERGTVSFVSRDLQKGPVRGGQIGSIFFVCLKERPEWDDIHVPFGKVVSGLETLEKFTNPSRTYFSSVTVLSESEYAGAAGAVTSDQPAVTPGNSEAVITTSKGKITVELYEDLARNTVANFITLADSGFFNKDDSGEGKQTFYDVLGKDGKTLAVITGSPTNQPDGHPGYYIKDEVNVNKCERGSLVMLKRYVPAEKRFEPDSAGSQFFICVQPIPYYDALGQFTVFGKVKSGLEVLDKLAEGDTVESIKMTKKRFSDYTVKKIPR